MGQKSVYDLYKEVGEMFGKTPEQIKVIVDFPWEYVRGHMSGPKATPILMHGLGTWIVSEYRLNNFLKTDDQKPEYKMLKQELDGKKMGGRKSR